MYVESQYFYTIYPELASTNAYEHHGLMTDRVMDTVTSGVDGVKKLRIAFPTDETDAEMVRRVWCELCYTAYMVTSQRAALATASQVHDLGNGVSVAGLVTSISSGGESMSFSGGANAVQSEYLKAAQTPGGELQLMRSIAREQLAGLTDANGVNLLFGGVYPHR